MNMLICLLFFASPAYKCDIPLTPPPGKCELHQTCGTPPPAKRVPGDRITPPPGKCELRGTCRQRRAR